MGLKPWEFERLQPQEFVLLFEGWRWRQERCEDTAAYFVSMLLNVEGKSLKKMISPKELTAPLRKTVTPKRSRKEDEEYLKTIFEPLERRRKGGG